jgi:spore coat polysaccharide biosynthesis protein SpsF (cytidylyltransferase family)
MTSHTKRQVTLHLCSHGFVPGYKVWYLHGESCLERAAEVEVDDGEDVDRMDHMLEDLQPELAAYHHDSPTPEV